MKRIGLALVLLAMVALIPLPAKAADYPAKPITLMTAFNAGGGSDISHRLIEKFAKKYISQPFVVAYKPGAGGEICWTWLTTANPDGYTICGVDLPHIVLQPLLREKGQPGYQTADIKPLCGLVEDPNVIMVLENSQFKTLKDLFDYAKANPGKVTVATVGKYAGDFIFLAMIEKLTGLKFSQVPYPGGGKARPALVSGEVMAYFGSASMFCQMEKGKARALAVSTKERYPLLPDVPTFNELGYKHESGKVRGLAVPPKFNRKAQEYLEKHLAEMCADPEYQKAVRESGLMPKFLSSKDFGKVIKDETALNTAVLKDAGIIQ